MCEASVLHRRDVRDGGDLPNALCVACGGSSAAASQIRTSYILNFRGLPRKPPLDRRSGSIPTPASASPISLGWVGEGVAPIQPRVGLPPEVSLV